MRILAVEDDPNTARTIQLMLNHAGMDVYTTDLGEAGADLASLYDYDLILLDVNLPDIDGIEVLRMIRQRGVNTPVMMLTGDDSTATKIKAFGHGADDYLSKPFHREELIARINARTKKPEAT